MNYSVSITLLPVASDTHHGRVFATTAVKGYGSLLVEHQIFYTCFRGQHYCIQERVSMFYWLKRAPNQRLYIAYNGPCRGGACASSEVAPLEQVLQPETVRTLERYSQYADPLRPYALLQVPFWKRWFR